MTEKKKTTRSSSTSAKKKTTRKKCLERSAVKKEKDKDSKSEEMIKKAVRYFFVFTFSFLVISVFIAMLCDFAKNEKKRMQKVREELEIKRENEEVGPLYFQIDPTLHVACDVETAIQKVFSESGRPYISWKQLKGINATYNINKLKGDIKRIFGFYGRDLQYIKSPRLYSNVMGVNYKIGYTKNPVTKKYSVFNVNKLKTFLEKKYYIIEIPTDIKCVYCAEKYSSKTINKHLSLEECTHLFNQNNLSSIEGTCFHHSGLPNNPLTITVESGYAHKKGFEPGSQRNIADYMIDAVLDKGRSWYLLSYIIKNGSPLITDGIVEFWQWDKDGNREMITSSSVQVNGSSQIKKSFYFSPSSKNSLVCSDLSSRKIIKRTGSKIKIHEDVVISQKEQEETQNFVSHLKDKPILLKIMAIQKEINDMKQELEKQVIKNTPIYDIKKKRLTSLEEFLKEVAKKGKIEGPLANDPIGVSYGIMKGDEESIEKLIHYAKHGNECVNEKRRKSYSISIRCITK